MTSKTEPQPGPNVHNGTYTIDHSDHGHFTVKLFTIRKGELEGRRMIAILIGPNNQADFKRVAFWDDQSLIARPFKKFRTPTTRSDLEYVFDGVCWQESWNATEKKIAIWCDMVKRGSRTPPCGYWHGFGYRIQLEGRCAVCNRALTDPISIETGIGPICRTRQS